MEVEQRFGITLRDAEAQRVRTVADLAALVISKLPRLSGICPTARAFYEFRQLAIAHGGVARPDVRPSTPVHALLGMRFRERWNTLRSHDRRLPRLVMTDGMDRAIMWLVCGLFLASILVGSIVYLQVGASPGLWMVVAGGGGLIGAALAGVSLLSRHLPAGIETVGNLAHRIALSSLASETPGGRLIAQQRILAEIQRITADVLGVPIQKVTPEADFVRDLEMD